MKKSIRSHYHWVIAAVALVQLLIYGGAVNNFSSYHKDVVSQSLGISTTMFSLAGSFRGVVGVFSTLMTGSLIQRIGYRRTAAIGLVSAALAYVLLAYMNSFWMLTAGCGLIGLASGICAGLGLGDNARAALATRALAEMTRLGMAMGGKMETFMGLSGMGDLVVTCYSEHSRNLTAGRMIAQGVPMQDCQARIGQVVEGIPNTISSYQLARKLGVRTPLTDAMYEILYCGKPARQALEELMGRDLRAENVQE
jgi:hypothetical protein